MRARGHARVPVAASGGARRFQRDNILAGQNLLTWQHGVAPADCELDPLAPCSKRILLTDRGSPGGHQPGRIRLRLTEVYINNTFLIPNPLDEWRGTMMAFASHEYGHALQFAWNRSVLDVFGPADEHMVATHPAFVEALVDLVGWDHCLFQQPDLHAPRRPVRVALAHPCRRPEARSGRTVLPHPVDEPLFSPGGTVQSLFFRYATEQYAVPRTPPRPISPLAEHQRFRHPGGLPAWRSDAPRAGPTRGSISSATSGSTSNRRRIRASSRRGNGSTPARRASRPRLSNVLLDLHSAVVLKDYVGRDLTTDARWHLERIGNLNRGGDADYFPANPRPAPGMSHVELKAAAALQPIDPTDPTKLGYTYFASEGLGKMHDDLFRAKRTLDSWIRLPTALTTPEIIFPRDTFKVGGTAIAPDGVAYLSVNPEVLDSSSYPIRIQASSR